MSRFDFNLRNPPLHHSTKWLVQLLACPRLFSEAVTRSRLSTLGPSRRDVAFRLQKKGVPAVCRKHKIRNPHVERFKRRRIDQDIAEYLGVSPLVVKITAALGPQTPRTADLRQWNAELR